MSMGPGQPAHDCENEVLVAEFESACRGGDYEFAPEYRNELLCRLGRLAQYEAALKGVMKKCEKAEAYTDAAYAYYFAHSALIANA